MEKYRKITLIHSLCVILLTAVAVAQDAVETNQFSPDFYSQLIQSDRPVAYWRMDLDERGMMRNTIKEHAELRGLLVGEVKSSAGPQAPTHPKFGEAKNAALEIPNAAGVIKVDDPGDDSVLDFKLGDSMTIEAWVQVSSVSGYRYILGKGRTGNKGFPAENQNYSLRLAGNGAITFLFRSIDDDGKQQYHRWTSNQGVGVSDGWHHVGLTYTFGQVGSLKGYIDGKSISGKWDEGGDTGGRPVVDNDQLWIGSALSAGPNSTLKGAIDEVAVYRKALPAEAFAQRYSFIRNEPKFDPATIEDNQVLVQIWEGVSENTFQYRSARLTDTYQVDAFEFFQIPNKYNEQGIKIDRSAPFMIRAYGSVTIPEGPQRILVRARNGARLFIDNEIQAEVPFFNISSSAHGKVFDVRRDQAPNIRPLQRGDKEVILSLEGDGKKHLLRFEMIVGSSKRRPETGETAVCIAAPDQEFRVLSELHHAQLTHREWPSFKQQQASKIVALDRVRRAQVSESEQEYWKERHGWTRRLLSTDKPGASPGDQFPESSYNRIDQYVNKQLREAGDEPRPLVDDSTFLRRLSLDTVGTIPSLALIQEFQRRRHSGEEARNWAIDFLLAQDEWADHWTSYWQDVLAENPNIINPTLNNTGPFRWWIHESFIDNKPMDRFVTELIMMEGSRFYGGPAGFSVASQNDVPLAAKAHILGQAFLGIQMQCARCHDAPFHEVTQKDLFSIAAMLKRKDESVPKTSTVTVSADGPVPNVPITLKPGAIVQPAWPFPELGSLRIPRELIRGSEDSRAKLAQRITDPGNLRFPRVMVNRLWKRTIGFGIVEPVEDWEHGTNINPDLLDYLGRELAMNGYDIKHVARLIFQSHTYQRQSIDITESGLQAFAGPVRRQMSAEQLIDSLFVASGRPFDAGPMNVDIDGARNYSNSLNLGTPKRAWQFASLSNERDRPSLSLPFAQPFTSTMQAFGWTGSRQNPINHRQSSPNVMQPAMMNNGIVVRDNARLDMMSDFTMLARQAETVENLIAITYQRVLSRQPTASERRLFLELLGEGFGDRLVSLSSEEAEQIRWSRRLPRNMVSWSNHLAARATEIKIELRQAVQQGAIPSPHLESQWRERMEDFVWVLFNSPEFLYIR